ncbi:MAG: PRC and DUF2382 domain-containing protein [Gemmatimonadaceae bacterium]
MDDRDTMGGSADLRRLKDLDDFQVADGYPDIRGWDVKTSDGQKLGEVKDLVVSVSEMRVRYLDVEVDREMRGTSGTDDEGHALIPIGSAELNDDTDDVIVSGLGSDLTGYPRYAGSDIPSDYETRLRDRMRGSATAAGAGAAAVAGAGSASTSRGTSGTSGSSAYDTEHYDDQRLYAKRRAKRDMGQDAQMGSQMGSQASEQRLTLSEEQLDISKRQVQAGEVEVRKTVETEHVTEQVPLTHEEVTVERRPMSDQGMAADARIGDNQEIRVPVMREEAVVQKRGVVREEIVIRKQMRTENKTVEADVRRERLDIDDAAGIARGGATGMAAGAAGAAGSTAGRTARDLGDKLADTADDLKDRVDANPASKPGRDATDRPGR